MPKSDYKICPKCKVRHSTLVRHRCFNPEEQKEKPKFEEPEKDDGTGKGGAGGEPDDGQGDGEGHGSGEGQGDGDEQGDGQGQGEEGDGEGDDEQEEEQKGQGQGMAEAQGDPPPPPASVVVTVLKFAALTAETKDSFITISLTPHGLMVYGQAGSATNMALIPWTEFEQRSTIDGEYYVKSVIDEVDDALGGTVEKDEHDEDLDDEDFDDEDLDDDENEKVAVIDWSRGIKFVGGVVAEMWSDKLADEGFWLVGITGGNGQFADNGLPEIAKLSESQGLGVYDGATSPNGSNFQIVVDEYGQCDGKQIVVNQAADGHGYEPGKIEYHGG